MSVGDQAPRFGSAFRGYDPDEVDRFAEEATATARELRERVAELEAERSELERELARLRGEFDATRSALPEIEELHAQLQRLREVYAARSDALQMLIAAAAREIGERTGVGPPPRPAPPDPRKRQAAGRARQPRPGTDETTTDEIEAAADAPAQRPEGPPVDRLVWHPDVDEPVRGDWSTEQPSDGRRA